MESAFTLHPQLAADTVPVADLPLSSLLLMKDANYPWLILVPRVAGIKEIIDLPPPQQTQFFAEVTKASELVRKIFVPDKINVAALGNMVPQLHMHIIARFTTDAAWPKPVWGHAPRRDYAPGDLDSRLSQLAAELKPFLQK